MKNYLRIMGMALLASGALFLGGCSDETEDNTVDSSLVGNWSNQLPDNNERTFSIELNGSFSATLNPGGTDGVGTVEGVLIREDDDYKMNNMREITGTDWGSAVRLYNGTYVQITFSENNTVFELTCKDNNAVEQFFGGIYHKQ